MRARFMARWRADVDLEPRFVARGSVLEIGSASGWRLAHLRRLGWDRVEGIELVAAAAEASRLAGFTVHSLPVEQALALYEDESLDAIVTSMVIEHLADPFAVVARLAKKLKPGGEFLFSTVRRDSVDAWIWGTYWRNLDLPRHMVWFTRGGLRRLLRPSFHRVRFTCQAETIDLVGSARYRQKEKWNPLDSVVTRLGERKLRTPMMLLAFAGWTSRVSIRATRRPS